MAAVLTLKNQPDEAEVHAQGAVDSRAVNAQEHTIRDTCPTWVFGGAIKTYLLEECNISIREDSQQGNINEIFISVLSLYSPQQGGNVTQTN